MRCSGRSKGVKSFPSPLARGWIGFYWGKSAAEYRADPDARDHRLIADWLDYFARKGPAMRP